MTVPIVAPKKLIEVALPLDEINKASGHEKSVRHGNPSTLHVWWAPRPLAAARAVLFAQMVNDPSWRYSTEELQRPQVRAAITRKRNELFRLIGELVRWENSNNEEVLRRARREIARSWAETCEVNGSHPDAARIFNPDQIPPFFDPFAGGGAIPLEAQRLGLCAHASDLNPVAVLINKAKIEIPCRFLGRHPVGPTPMAETQQGNDDLRAWQRAEGLAEDVRRYGRLLIEDFKARNAHLYPTVRVTDAMLTARPDLKRYAGRDLQVIAWIWARTVPSPNPAHRGARVPLVNSFWLAKKPGKEAWVEPQLARGTLSFKIRVGKPADADAVAAGTKASKGNFKWGTTAIPPEYIRAEGMAGRLQPALMAIVCEGDRERVYLDPLPEQADVAENVEAVAGADAELPQKGLGFRVQAYGFRRFKDLFTPRQQVALGTVAELIGALHERVRADAAKAGWPEGAALELGGRDARAYADAMCILLAMLLGRCSDFWSTLATWSPEPKNELVSHAFTMHTIQMTWDFGEVNPLSDSGGSLATNLKFVVKAVERLGVGGEGSATQVAAQEVQAADGVVSTDPPYYDNIGYADLSDYFYIWHRLALRHVLPALVASIKTPKFEEIISDPDRQGGGEEAEKFFLTQMQHVLRRLSSTAHPSYPLSLYYAFKQADSNNAGTSSRGWETFLQALVDADLQIVGTWPIHTERAARSRGIGANALASSIVLVCRPRVTTATTSKRAFLQELERQMPAALAELTADPDAAIAPADLAQACIGPGMALFSKYSGVLAGDGSPLTVHDALLEINRAIDSCFSTAEGEFDSDTRFCLGWFQQYGFESGPFGEADVLARARGTSVDGVKAAGVLHSGKGKVRLLKLSEYPGNWDPKTDARTPIWEALHQICRALAESEHAAGALLAQMPEKADPIRQLAYQLYTLCERKRWALDARSYNELITSWPAIVEESRKAGHKNEQLGLL